MSNHIPSSVPLVDNDVQAPLAPSVLAAVIDLPLPPSMNEYDDEPQSRRGKTLGSTSAKSSTSTQKGKPGSLGLNTDEAQKKLGKFFKGLGPSKAFFLMIKPKLIPSCLIRNIGSSSLFVYLTLTGHIQLYPTILFYQVVLESDYGCSFSHLATLSTRSLFLPLTLSPLFLKNALKMVGQLMSLEDGV
jgi:hypothetical protein